MEHGHIGIDLGGTKTELIVLGKTGEELWRERRPTPKQNYSAIVEQMASMVATARQQLPLILVSSVGVGIPGSVSALTGKVRNANTVVLNQQPLMQDLHVATRLPVKLENDANCMAVSEATDGAGAGCAVVFAAILGTGCGGAIVANGKLLAGHNLIGGEWGHYPLPQPKIWPHEDERPGPACYCGRQGCQETWLSGTGFAADFQRATGKVLVAQDIVQFARAGDAAAAACLARYIDRLARALAVVINLLDPNVIVLAGGMSNITELYSALPSQVRPYVVSDTFTTPIVPARHGDSSGVRGAAWLWSA